jgi:hypothetical protein
MITSTKSLALATCLALTLGGQLSLRAEDAPPARQRPPGDGPRGFRGGPGFDSLSQEEKDKLRAASEKAQQDEKVKAAREKMETAGKEFRETMQAAQIAADPSVEPILKKLQEAREKAQKEGGGQRGGDQPKK